MTLLQIARAMIWTTVCCLVAAMAPGCGKVGRDNRLVEHSSAVCTPNCAEECGGPDGCGGNCRDNCVSPQTCGGGSTAYVCGCTPKTCAALGKNCGAVPDGCGGR